MRARLPPCTARSGIGFPLVGLAIAAISAGGRALAQPLDEPGGAIEVVVRGDTAGAYASRASADDSPRAPIDAASILDELPSVHVRRLGAEGSFALLSVRGSASSQVGVFLAGIPLTSAADPALDVGSLPLWPGASFRVHRGFAPAALGTTGYLGGVLAIEPPSPAEEARTSWWTAAGSFGGLKLRVGELRRAGDLTVATGLFASRADGDFSYELSDPISGARRTLTRTNAGHAAAGGLARAALELPWGSVGAIVFGDARRQGLPGAASHPTTVSRFTAGRLVVGVDATARTSGQGAARALFWGRREGTTFADPLGEIDPLRPGALVEDTIEAAGGSLGWRGRPLDPLTLGITLDARGERFSPRDPARVGARRLAGGAGADLTWRAITAEAEGRPAPLTLAASARLDGRSDHAGPADRVSREIAPSGHLGASLILDPAAVISAHAGALRRSPSFVELYGDRGALRGSPTLRPERALSADAGLHGDLGDAGLRFGYELVGFATAVRDLIVFTPLGRSTFRAENLDRGALLGAELTLSLAARGLRTSLSYTLLHARNTGDDPLTAGRPLPGRPAHDLAYDAAYRLGPASLRYGLDAVAGTTVDAGGTIVLPARVLHGVGAALQLTGAPGATGLRAAVDVDNLFDLRTLYASSPISGRPVPLPVSDFLGFPLPGRSIWLTLQWSSPPGR